ncbi:hypothetical protein AB2S62_00360 [Vibrio sp. NTOU-M3]|uniref:hypothetical protein n=1 Tax=Vibrio sp. NTOU-M3 TaxID=3234954 RepID=UPI00349FA7A9
MRKSTFTIYFLLSALMAVVLSMGIARAENLPNSSHLTTSDVHHALTLGSIEKSEPGCCEPGGSCFKKQCCSHGHASNTAVMESRQRSYDAPYRYEHISYQTILYASADMHVHYRPPIA